MLLDREWMYSRLAWEQSFQIYEFHEHPLRKAFVQFAQKYIKADYCVLDLGCKYGEMANLMAGFGARVIGIDYDASAIEVAKKRFSKTNLEFICDSAEHYLETTQIEFDVLILSHIVEHIDNPVEVLSAKMSKFKFVYFELPDFESSYLNVFRRDTNNPLNYTDNDHVYEYDRQEFSGVIDLLGLRIIESEFRFGNQKYWCERKEMEK